MAEENFINFGEEFDKQEFGLIDDGTYEVFIKTVEKAVSKKGTEMLKFTFKIRNDVEQNFKNREIWYYINKREGDNCYDFNRINKIILTQNDYPRRLKDFDEVLLYLHGLNLRIDIETVFSDTLGKDTSKVKEWSFAKSEAVPNTVAKADDAVTLPTDDNDLPF